MKRNWAINIFWDGLKLRLGIYFDFPDKDDYYESQYNLYIVLFGLHINIWTWKE